MSTTEQQVRALLAADDPRALLERMQASPPEDLLPVVVALLGKDVGYEGHWLVRLIEPLGQPAVDALRGILRHGKDRAVVQLLRSIPQSWQPFTSADLLPLLRRESADVVGAALSQLGQVGDRSVAPEIHARWDSPHRLDVALCLGRLRATQYHADLVALLDEPDSVLGRQGWEFVATALEAMAEPATVPAIRARLADAPPHRVWSLCQILRACSPVDRTGDWIGRDGKGDPETLRQGWLSTEPIEPGITSYEPAGPGTAEVVLVGTAKLRIGYPLATSVGNWARWQRALYWGDEVLYNANSDCGTCETYLARAGAELPRPRADQVGAALADVPRLSRERLDPLAPLLALLASGRYGVALVDTPIERVPSSHKERSWYAKREALRRPEDPTWSDPDDAWPVYVDWPGTSHFQRPSLLRRSPPTSMTILPTQPIDHFDEPTLERRRAAIEAGAHPAAIAIAWHEHRDIRGDCPEAMLQCVVLDGHHTLEAYRRAERDARLLLLLPHAYSRVPAPTKLVEALCPTS